MALAQVLSCKKRAVKNKGYLNKIRREGNIPGIVYGSGKENIPVFFDQREVNRTFSSFGSRGLFSLEIEGESPCMALVRELQQNPLNGNITHIDFLSVRMDEKITSNVFVNISGEEEINKKGGILQIGANEVEISCLPKDLPDQITCDVSGLELGEKITVEDLEVSEDVEVISPPDLLIVSVLIPTQDIDDEEEVEEVIEEEEIEEETEKEF